MNKLILPLPCLDIEHHYGIRGVQLNDLGQINLIVGANNCGKTIVLDYVFDTCYKVGNHFPVKFVHTYKVLGLPFLVPRSPQESAEIAQLLAIADPGITRVDDKSLSLYVYHQRFGFADFRRLGSGVQRLIQIALAISHSENGVVLIDDIEIGIHWDIFREVFPWLVQWAKKYNVQVFATTHNIYVVDALIDATDLDSDLVLYRLEPRESETRIIRHDRDALKRLREMGQRVL